MLKKSDGKRETSPPFPVNDENARLYKALRIICGFSHPEDLFELKKQNFLRLCEITQIHWELKGPLFRDSSVLKVGPVFSGDHAERESGAGLKNGKAGDANVRQVAEDNKEASVFQVGVISPRKAEDTDIRQATSADKKVSLFRAGAAGPRPGKVDSNFRTAKKARGFSDEKGAFVSEADRPPAPSGSLKIIPGAGRLERALTSGGRRYGKLIFISSRKISRKQKTFLSRIGDMVSSSLCFMEDTKQLEASKNQWDLVFDSFYRALCITDSQFRILRTNGAFRRLTGRKKTETAGQNVFTVFPIPVSPPPSQNEEVTWLAESSPKVPPLSLEFLMKTVFLKNERLTFRLFLIKDVTEEIKMERKIADQTRSRELGLIKSSLAHELNNPIAGIKALLTVIESGLTCSSQRRLLGNMHSAVNRCQETVARLLSVSRRDRFNRKADAV